MYVLQYSPGRKQKDPLVIFDKQLNNSKKNNAVGELWIDFGISTDEFGGKATI